jgi:hypothetical protein
VVPQALLELNLSLLRTVPVLILGRRCKLVFGLLIWFGFGFGVVRSLYSREEKGQATRRDASRAEQNRKADDNLLSLLLHPAYTIPSPSPSYTRPSACSASLWLLDSAHSLAALARSSHSDIPAGTSISFQIRDGSGQLNYSDPVTIQGSDE